MFDEIRKGTTGALDKARLVFNRDGSNNNNDDVESQQGANNSQASSSSSSDRLEELAAYCPQLTFQQRLIGFAVSFSIGYLIAFFSFRFFIHLVEGHPIPFALNYTFGHILQLLASTFLCGPKRQFKNMFDEKRRITSIVYLSCCESKLRSERQRARFLSVSLFLSWQYSHSFFIFITLTTHSGRQSNHHFLAPAGTPQTHFTPHWHDGTILSLGLVLA